MGYTKKNLGNKGCKRCGKKFKVKTVNQIYCSKKCCLNYSDKDKTRFPYYKVRFEVLSRDEFTCQYCGSNVERGAKLHIDHLKPRKKGGTNKHDNLVTACEQCNLGKSDVLLQQRQEEKIKKMILRRTTEKIKETINKNQGW